MIDHTLRSVEIIADSFFFRFYIAIFFYDSLLHFKNYICSRVT